MTHAGVIFAVALTASLGTAEPLDTAALDRQIFDVLREVHNRGADLHNAGDAIGCYRMYQGGLMALKPLLAHRPATQRAIEDGMQLAERRPAAERAVILHKVIADVRGQLQARASATRSAELGMPNVVRPTLPAPSPLPLPAGAAPVPFPDASTPGTLWNRLGGEKKVEKIVDDWITKCVADPKVNLNRGGKYKLDDESVAALKRRFTGYVSSVSEGTAIPTREPLKDAHALANFTNDEFAAIVDQLKAALKSNGVADAETNQLAKKVEDGRADVLGAPEKAPGPP